MFAIWLDILSRTKNERQGRRGGNAGGFHVPLAARLAAPTALFLLIFANSAAAQTTPEQPAETPAATSKDAAQPGAWRNANTGGAGPIAGNEAAADGAKTPAQPPGGASETERRPVARVSKGNGTLPNDQGQQWREYDITPYTLRVTSTKRPEQAIVDWILRETGYEAWHSETVAVLSADKRTLRAYHTPKMQQIVAGIVDRFVNSEAESHTFGLTVVTVNSPNWRANVQRMLKPIPVESQGVQAWLLAKEDAALLLSQLRKRSDAKEHTSPHLIVHNGQSTVVGTMRSRPYTKSIILRPGQWPGFTHETGYLDEGYSLEFSPLLSLDGRTIDAVVKCNINQIEKMIPVTVDVPTQYAKHQQQRIEVPQTSGCTLHERFRWPADQVLLISRGVVAAPMPAKANPLKISIPFVTSDDSRSDALVFIQGKGKTAPDPAAVRTGARDNQRYHGRY